MKIAAMNRKGVNTSFYGKTHTAETKAKMAKKNIYKSKNYRSTNQKSFIAPGKRRSFKISRHRRIHIT